VSPQLKLEIARIRMAEAREALREALEAFGDAISLAEMGDPETAKPADHALFEQFEREFDEVLRPHGYFLTRIPE
jgi:hypothetical protein